MDYGTAADLLVMLGGSRPDARTWERVSGAFEEVKNLSDEDLALLLAGVRQSVDGRASQTLESVRVSIRSLIELRISRRQQEQAEALTAAVEQLRKTENALDRLLDRVSKVAPALGALTKQLGEGS